MRRIVFTLATARESGSQGLASMMNIALAALSTLIPLASSHGQLVPVDSTSYWSAEKWDLTFGLAWGDVDGDGDLDLASGNKGQPIRIHFNENGMLANAASCSRSRYSSGAP